MINKNYLVAERCDFPKGIPEVPPTEVPTPTEVAGGPWFLLSYVALVTMILVKRGGYRKGNAQSGK